MANSPERKKRTCIVPVCNGERYSLVHKFPMDNQRATQWKDLIKNPILNDMSLDLIRKRYFVCSRHFKVQDYKNIKSRGLNKTSIPTLNMNEFSDPENFNRFESSMVYHIDINDKVVDETDFKNKTVQEALPSLAHDLHLKIKKRKIEVHEKITLIELPVIETVIPEINLVEEVEEEESLIEEHLKDFHNSEIEIIMPETEEQRANEIENNRESKLRIAITFNTTIKLF